MVNNQYQHNKPLVGNPAPLFVLPSTVGAMFNLAEHLANPLVLFFYPRDFTPLCTLEACSFRNSLEAFRGCEVRVIGISGDDISTHQSFQRAYNLPFELLSDEGHRVAARYNALFPLIHLPRRKTFFLETGGRIAGIYENNWSGAEHSQKLLQWVKSMPAFKI